jgi:cell division protein FtsW
VVLALFVVLAIGMVRVIRLSPDPFARTVTGGVLAWVIGQALVNIAVVLGLLPVLGVPLPLISAGGSALIMTLVAIGVVLSFARDLPGRAGAAESAGRVPYPEARNGALR